MIVQKRLTACASLFLTPLLWLGISQSVLAQSTSTQCGEYVEAYKRGAESYAPFLQIAQKTARTRDGYEHTKRYTRAFQGASPASTALWLNNWCTQNPLKNISEASDRLLDELTGQTPSDTSPAQSSQPPQVVIIQPRPAAPSACRVGDNGSCSGCSVMCGNGFKAKCRQGSETADRGYCEFQSICICVADKKAPPAQINAEGVSSCRVGNNGVCSGCSVTCNNGQTPTCKQGSLTADREKCEFQAECICK